MSRSDVVTLGFEFSSARSDGAFLIPGGRARRVSRYLKENTFVDYLLEHCDLILSMYSEYPWDECSLMILKGTTRSIAWGRGLTTQTARGVAGHISISVPAIGIPMLSLDVSHHRAALQHVCSSPKVGSKRKLTHCAVADRMWPSRKL